VKVVLADEHRAGGTQARRHRRILGGAMRLTDQ
jgi:hypothetical protein